MLLSSAASAALLAPRDLPADSTVVKTVTTTIHPEYTTTVVVGGPTEEIMVLGSPSVVEMYGTTTSIKRPSLVTHTEVDRMTLSVELEAQTLGKESLEVTGKLDGDFFTATVPFTTAWTYPGTTLGLSFSPRQTTFKFTGTLSKEITIPSERTYFFIDGTKTPVNFPALTTVITVTDPTNVIMGLIGTTTAMEYNPETFEFTISSDTIGGNDEARFCGTDESQIITGQLGSVIGSPCVAGTTFVTTLPSEPPTLFLSVDGPATILTLSNVTTTYVPVRTLTIVGESSTKTSPIPAVVSTFVTTEVISMH